MKILVTGASGFIGRTLTESLENHELILWSRTQVSPGTRGEYSAAADLCRTEWWRNVEVPEDVDVVIHLAEPVKVKLSSDALASVVSSHRAFLENACDRARLVIYPNTAYRYDRRVSTANRQYLAIKTEVVRSLSTRNNFISPVIHPIVDSGGGALARLIRGQHRLPCFNIFCAFNARLPVLTKPVLISSFKRQLGSSRSIDPDWYDGYSTIAELTARDDRRDLSTISNIFKWSLIPLSNVPMISTLTKGRAIPGRDGLASSHAQLTDRISGDIET